MYMFHANNGKTLNYTGAKLPDYGVWLLEESAALCNYGLHASPLPSQARYYNPGPFLDLVEVKGAAEIGTDKVSVCKRVRRATIDMREVSIFIQQQVVLKALDTFPNRLLDSEQDRIIEFVMNPTVESAARFRNSVLRNQPHPWTWDFEVKKAMRLANSIASGDFFPPQIGDWNLFNDECVLRFNQKGYAIRIIG